MSYVMWQNMLVYPKKCNVIAYKLYKHTQYLNNSEYRCTSTYISVYFINLCVWLITRAFHSATKSTYYVWHVPTMMFCWISIGLNFNYFRIVTRGSNASSDTESAINAMPLLERQRLEMAIQLMRLRTIERLYAQHSRPRWEHTPT